MFLRNQITEKILIFDLQLSDFCDLLDFRDLPLSRLGSVIFSKGTLRNFKKKSGEDGDNDEAVERDEPGPVEREPDNSEFEHLKKVKVRGRGGSR